MGIDISVEAVIIRMIWSIFLIRANSETGLRRVLVNGR